MDDLQPCEHDKVYANIVYLTYPGQRPWICRKCLTEGVEVDKMANDGDEYWRLTTIARTRAAVRALSGEGEK